MDNLQAEQDIIQNFLEINEAESQVKSVGMDSDGEEEIVEDKVSKVEPAKTSKVVAKVSLRIFLVSVSKTNKVCWKPPWKAVGLPKCVRKNKLKPKPTPLFNDDEDDVLFPEPSELLVQFDKWCKTKLFMSQ